jgi:adenosylhomocysteine nucleosidase
MHTIGVIAAIRTEAAPLIRGLRNPRRGRAGAFDLVTGDIADKTVTVVVSGVGGRAAHKAAAALIEGIPVDLIVSIGFAGGLVPDFSRGTIVVSHEVTDETGDRTAFPTLDRFVVPPPGKGGVVVTCSRFVYATKHKRELAEKLGAVAVDMESLYIGRAAQEAGVPFLVVRVISDDLSHELPFLGPFFTNEGGLDLARAIPRFVRHPGTFIPLVRFMGGLVRYAATLDRYLLGLIAGL